MPGPSTISIGLDEWLAWASRSKLAPFVKASRTIPRYKDGIIEHVKSRITNGIIEGFNTHADGGPASLRSYHNAEAFIAMMFLCCGGITLTPPLP